MTQRIATTETAQPRGDNYWLEATEHSKQEQSHSFACKKNAKMNLQIYLDFYVWVTLVYVSLLKKIIIMKNKKQKNSFISGIQITPVFI